ncbi:hypothetical protein M9458_016371, partial [Cirrhinus mrigala]
MEQCAAPQLENTSTHSSPTDPAEKPGRDAGEMTVKDAYECRICGYKAQDVKCLSQHLHTAHPVTSLSDSVRNERRDALEEECVDDAETPCLNGDLEKSIVKDK